MVLRKPAHGGFPIVIYDSNAFSITDRSKPCVQRHFMHRVPDCQYDFGMHDSLATCRCGGNPIILIEAGAKEPDYIVRRGPIKLVHYSLL